MSTATQSLQSLQRGNQRFTAKLNNDEQSRIPRQLVDVQEPIAIVLSCADSRVPPEIVFDQGIGQLFVVRVAGNIVDLSQMGSVEFAAQHLAVPLLVVLGHSGCAAVKAALASLEEQQQYSPALSSIVEIIESAIGPLLATHSSSEESLLAKSVRANIISSAQRLYQGSEILKSLVDNGALQIATAEYDVSSGEVVFFESTVG